VVKITGATTSSPTSSVFVAPNSGGLNFPSGLSWGPDGNFYVVDLGATSFQGNVLQYAPDGSFLKVVTPTDPTNPGDLLFQFPSDMVFDGQGHFLTANLGPAHPPNLAGSINQYNTDGTFDQVLVNSGEFPNTGSGTSGISPSEMAIAPTPIQIPLAVRGVVVNGDNAALDGAQRSMVDSIVYKFNQPVTAGANAFSIALHPDVTVDGQSGQTVGTLPTLNWSTPDGGITWVVTFSGNGVVGNSIADGVYDITLNHTAVTGSSGQALAADQTDTVYRLFGDLQGNGTVNAADTRQLSKAFGTTSGSAGYLAALDYDANGAINAIDSSQFKKRFGTVYSGFTPTI
jgi:hypothetical protein